MAISNTISKHTADLRFSSPVFRHALRGAIAVTVAIAAARGLALTHAVWVPICVLVVMRPSLGGTLQMSWKRFSGTVIGAVIGVFLLLFHPSILTVGIGISLLAVFMLYFKAKHYVLFIGTLTASVVLILGTLFAHTWQGGLERVVDTFIGVSIGLCASFLIWPNFARKALRKEMGDLIYAQHEHFKDLRTFYFDNKKENSLLLAGRLKASARLESCSEKFKDAGIEPGLRASQRQQLVNLIALFTRIHRTLTAMASIVNKSTGVFHGDIRCQFEELMEAVDEQFEVLEVYARTDEVLIRKREFNTTFNAFMGDLSQMRSEGKFENFTLDSRNNASAFIRQIHRLGVELTRAKERIETLRKVD